MQCEILSFSASGCERGVEVYILDRHIPKAHTEPGLGKLTEFLELLHCQGCGLGQPKH